MSACHRSTCVVALAIVTIAACHPRHVVAPVETSAPRAAPVRPSERIDPMPLPPRDPVPATARVAEAPRVEPPARPSGPGDAAELTGAWAGTYLYGARGGTTVASVAFFADLSFDGARIVGSTIEPNTFGDDSSGELRATIAGTIDDDGLVRFIKTYDGAAGVAHRVEYVGRLDVAAQRIEGTWSLEGNSGRFVMARHHAMPQLALSVER